MAFVAAVGDLRSHVEVEGLDLVSVGVDSELELVFSEDVVGVVED